MKRLLAGLLFLVVLLVSGCSASDPLTEDLYTEGEIYIWDGSAWQPVSSSSGNVTAAANLADNYVIRGDGGGKGVQDSLVSINDFGTLNAPVFTGENIQVTGKLEADRLFADLEGYSVDVVQASSLNITEDDTLVVDFLFEPDVIVIDYSARCWHDTTYESGHSTGHSLITITAANTMTCNTNMTALVDNAGAVGSVGIQDNTAYVVTAYGGYDGATDSYIFGSGSWVSATHTLTITFVTVANTYNTNNLVEMIATAYR